MIIKSVRVFGGGLGRWGFSVCREESARSAHHDLGYECVHVLSALSRATIAYSVRKIPLCSTKSPLYRAIRPESSDMPEYRSFRGRRLYRLLGRAKRKAHRCLLHLATMLSVRIH